MSRMLSALSLAVLTIAAAAQTPATAINQLFGFPCDATLTACLEGSFPNGLIEGADGNFYGITVAGGTGLNSQGTVFQITPGGVLNSAFQLCRAARRQPARRRRAHQFGRRYGRLPAPRSWMAATGWQPHSRARPNIRRSGLSFRHIVVNPLDRLICRTQKCYRKVAKQPLRC